MPGEWSRHIYESKRSTVRTEHVTGDLNRIQATCDGLGVDHHSLTIRSSSQITQQFGGNSGAADRQ